jgi:uncharacterized protein (DUF1800 family)
VTTAIALNRFGLGARPDETAPADPKHWLLGQTEGPVPKLASSAALPTTATIVRDFLNRRQEMRSAKDDAKAAARKEMRQDLRDIYLQSVDARAVNALVTPAPFVERLVHFWANHFAVSADKVAVIPLAGAFEAEAIRPHVLGRFKDLLLAVERHVAMQVYLDQARSIGPNSPFAKRVESRRPDKKPGLNENLAREIMELHTVGVRGGYTQADVTEFARALTGWSVGGMGRNARGSDVPPGGFVFRPALHEPGTRTIMSKTYRQKDEAQALAVLHDLATARATADHIALKLARHFVADEPPPALVQKLSTAFSRSGGDLPTVYRALIEAPESWTTQAVKFKTPWEWFVSALRGVGLRELGRMKVAPVMNQLGQPVWRPGSPAGFDDVAARWAAPDALMRRVEFADRLAARIGDRIDARRLSGQILPGAVSEKTERAIARAENSPNGLALLLVSPEFQRR